MVIQAWLMASPNLSFASPRLPEAARKWFQLAMKSNPTLPEIAKVCPKSWDGMRGDSKRRFCEHCQLHVTNLSAMSPREVDEFVSLSGGKACIAYEVRGDGSTIAPSRWAFLAGPFRRAGRSFATFLAAALPFCFSACTTRRTMGTPLAPSDAKSVQQPVSPPAELLGEMAPKKAD